MGQTKEAEAANRDAPAKVDFGLGEVREGYSTREFSCKLCSIAGPKQLHCCRPIWPPSIANTDRWIR